MLMCEAIMVKDGIMSLQSVTWVVEAKKENNG
jgi:hypothetical protein